MPLRKHRPVALGLDVGSKAVKAICLRLVDRRPELLGAGRLLLGAEGILDEQELRESIAGWVQQSGWKGLEACTSLPQYLTTVQVRDFPAAPPGGLAKMIAFETRHLSGISEERFITDYQVLSPAAGRKNPVLIGICRESVIDERMGLLAAAGLLPAHLTMNGLAALNALFDLAPETPQEKRPQLLLDIGADSATATVFAEGHPLFSGSLLIGGERFTQELAAARGIEPAQAEESKRQLRIEPGQEDEPLGRVARNLRTELAGMIEQWRSQETATLRAQPLAGIWLCGGGARLDGLAEFLAAEHGCPAAVFGPRLEPGKGPEPDLAVAYGLALQGVDKAEVAISLTPADLRWRHARRRNFPHLVAACVLLAAVVAVWMVGHYRTLRQTDRVQRQEIARLNQCGQVIPDIERYVKEIRRQERLMLPLVLKGGHAGRVLAACREISAAVKDEAFFVYLTEETEAGDGPAAAGPRTVAPPEFIWVGGIGEDTARSGEFEELVDVRKLAEPSRLILGGYTLSPGKQEHYEIVRAVRQKLDESYLFGNARQRVDIVSESEFAGFIPVFPFWTAKVIENPALRQFFRRERLREFVLRLPFAEPNLHREALKP